MVDDVQQRGESPVMIKPTAQKAARSLATLTFALRRLEQLHMFLMRPEGEQTLDFEALLECSRIGPAFEVRRRTEFGLNLPPAGTPRECVDLVGL